MAHLSPATLVSLAALLGLGASTSCLVRTRKPQAQPAIARTATLNELLGELNRFKAIQTLRSTVNLQLSFVTQEDDKLKEYSNVRGFILIERPENIRVIAQVPVVRTTAFQMASDGQSFRVFLPTKRRFLVGETSLNELSEKRIENVRPQHILQALLIDPPRENERAFLENEIEGLRAYHVVGLISLDGNGLPKLKRKFWFDRIQLSLVRQEVFDDAGDVATIAYYREWAEREGVPLPNLVHIDRKREKYQLQVRILEAGVNVALKPDTFVLEPPPDIKIERIGEPKQDANGGGSESD